jgi:two-component sensor histidine kinase
MKATSYAICLLLLLGQLSFAQDDDFNDLSIDSALVWLNDNHVENPDDFHPRALSTLAKVYQLQDDQLKGEAHLVLMRWHGYHVPFTMDSISYHGEKALTLFKRTNDLSNLAFTSSKLVVSYEALNDLERAEELAFEAIRIYEALGDPKGVGVSYRRLAGIYGSQKAPELALKYALEALALTENTDDHYNTALAWLVLIDAYRGMGELENAVQAGEHCIAVVNKFVPEEVFILARAYARRAKVWTILKNHQQAIADASESYAIVERQIGAARPSTKSFREGIGDAYYVQGDFQAAVPHFTAAIDGYVQLGQNHSPAMQELYKKTADCFYQLGDLQEAYLNQQLAHNVFDTLMQEKIANLESEALFKYESGKKDQAIAEQATIIEQNSRIQWLGMGFIGLLLLFLSTLFYYFRRNKKIADALLVKNKENELLLKEIHHRVKNNLQTVSSLLSLQSESISDKSAFDAVQESKNRVNSMALLHQKLYQGENLAAIEMRDYFETIGKAIIDSFGERAKNVSLEVDMSKIELDVDTAVPVGLITNELITNSIKHAFPDQQKGQILITLTQDENDLLKLQIADNGQNMTNGSVLKKESGFGTLLVQLLTTQLGGKLEKSTEAGTSIMIRFPRQEKAAA